MGEEVFGEWEQLEESPNGRGTKSAYVSLGAVYSLLQGHRV